MSAGSLMAGNRRDEGPSCGAEPTRAEAQAGRPKQTCLLAVACINVPRTHVYVVIYSIYSVFLYVYSYIYSIYSVFFICFRYGVCQGSPYTCLRHGATGDGSPVQNIQI
jgi:hypothetical protein